MLIAEKICRLRTQLGLSASEFAERINVSRSLVHDWEVGKCRPNFESLSLICTEFHVSADYLLFDSDLVFYDLSEECEILVDVYLSIDSSLRRKVLEYASHLLPEGSPRICERGFTARDGSGAVPKE